MKLLILTQAVDLDDNALSFFHRWIEEFAPHYEKITVICLKEGRHSLPANVKVYSLGKESGVSRFKYITRFYRYIGKLRKEYDTVFIHMNEEYGILGGWLWRGMGKKVTMWRNHHAGSFRTDIAVFFCNAVFCTSKFSYTARFKKTVLMPVGVDTERFTPEKGGAPEARHAADSRMPRSILFFSGMWQTKRPEMLLDALALLTQKGISYTADFYGSPLPDGQAYYESIQKRAVDNGISDFVKFYPGVPNDQAPALFRAHEIFVNCSESGMFDKMLFEAAACGCRVIASSEDFATLAHDPSTHFRTTEELAHCLEVALSKPSQSQIPDYVAQNSLASLAARLKEALYTDHSQKKTIAFLINSFGFGGAERVFIDDANEFARHGYGVYFFTLYKGMPEKVLESELDPSITQIFLNAKSSYDIRAVHLCSKELRASGTRVLISTLNDGNRIGQLVALFSGLKIKLIEREANTLRSKTSLQKTLDAVFFWVPYKIIALSTEIQRSLMHLLPFSQGKIILLPNAIKVPKETGANTHVSDAGHIPLVLSVGRLTEQKNYELLISAVESLQKKGLNFLVEIVGEGMLRESLEKQIHEAGLEKIVSLKGHLPHEQVLEDFEKAHIFVSTSRWEGSPNVVLEALSYGLPVVATRVGGVSDIIKDGVQGLLISSGNKEELEAALERLLKDVDLRKTLGTAARERVQKDFSKEARFARLRAIVEAAT